MCTFVCPEFKSIRSGLRHQIGLMNYLLVIILKYLVGEHLGPQNVVECLSLWTPVFHEQGTY